MDAWVKEKERERGKIRQRRTSVLLIHEHIFAHKKFLEPKYTELIHEKFSNEINFYWDTSSLRYRGKVAEQLLNKTNTDKNTFLIQKLHTNLYYFSTQLPVKLTTLSYCSTKFYRPHCQRKQFTVYWASKWFLIDFKSQAFISVGNIIQLFVKLLMSKLVKLMLLVYSFYIFFFT